MGVLSVRAASPARDVAKAGGVRVCPESSRICAGLSPDLGSFSVGPHRAGASSSLDALYVDLPVVPLKSWSEITPKNLDNWLSTHGHCGANHEKLRSSYWVN